MKIEIVFQEASKMRYYTIGDYYYKRDGTLRFEIVDTGNPFYNKCILIHEMAEQSLTEQLGITEKSISDFDNKFEDEREKGIHNTEAEPGFDPRSPYRHQHAIANSFEMIMCAAAGINWNEYSNYINSL